MIIFERVRPDRDIVEAIQEQIKRTPALMQRAFSREVARSVARLKPKIVTYPSALPTLPFVWSNNPAANARARAYYFGVILKRKRGRGGRYKRTGRLGRSWKFKKDSAKTSGSYTVENEYRGAVYVQGTRQVPSHSRTPWSRADREIEREMVTLNNNLIDIWYTVADPFAGVPRK